MAEITQTETEIKIIIKLINITSRRPDVVLLKRYIKFNCPPTFFEAHLTDDIDEKNSCCKLFKREARIILKKVNEGLWEQIVEQPQNKAEALEKRKEKVDELQRKNVEIEKQAVTSLDKKKKSEIRREIKRETILREKYEGANEKFLENELGVTVEETKKVKEKQAREVKKKQRNFKAKYIDEEPDEEYKAMLEKEKKEKEEELERQALRNQYVGPKIDQREAAVLLQKAEGRKEIRRGGSIKVSFTKFEFKTPRRESQKQIQDEVLTKRKMSQGEASSKTEPINEEAVDQDRDTLEGVD